MNTSKITTELKMVPLFGECWSFFTEYYKSEIERAKENIGKIIHVNEIGDIYTLIEIQEKEEIIIMIIEVKMKWVERWMTK